MSDRTNMAILDAARVGSNTDIALPNTVVAQRDQRFWEIQIGGPLQAAINLNTNYTWYALRFDRAVRVTAAQFSYPLANIASNGTNYSVVTMFQAADGVAAASAVAIAAINTANTAITSYTPAPFALTQANITLNANTTVFFTTAQNGAGNAPNLANANILQFTWQEI